MFHFAHTLDLSIHPASGDYGPDKRWLYVPILQLSNPVALFQYTRDARICVHYGAKGLR
jgi:hypothetical protein